MSGQQVLEYFSHYKSKVDVFQALNTFSFKAKKINFGIFLSN